MSERLKNQKFREGLVILLLGIALGVYSLYKFYTAAVKTSWIMSPYLFPLLLSAFTVLVSLSLLLEAVHELRAAAKEDGKGKMNLKNVAVVMLLCIAYAVLLPHLGFIFASMLFLAALIWFLGERKIWLLAAISVVMPLLLYVIFGVLLSVRLP